MSVRYNDDFKREVARAYMAGNTSKSNKSESASEIRRLNQMLKEKDKEIEF